MTETTIHTPYGDVSYSPDSVSITADGAQLYAWANRPGAQWPCSDLTELDEIGCSFDTSGLFELDETPRDAEVTADEFNAWSSDVLREALPNDHAAYYVTVGQFGQQCCDKHTRTGYLHSADCPEHGAFAGEECDE